MFDFVAALPIYVDEGGAIIEAVDIAGVAKDFKMAREVTELWLPEGCEWELSAADTSLVVRLAAAPADSLTMSGTLFVREQG